MSLNERVQVEEGEHGTIVVVSAWCSNCEQQAIPDRDNRCMFCGTEIVDPDQLSAKELRAQLDGRQQPPARVIPLREVVTPAIEAPPQLQIAEGFALPIDIAGEATAILAKRGAGKTNTARVLCEEYVRVGVPVVVLDPIGVWWGLRSAADGEHDGLALPVLGGEHGDMELAPWAGGAIADSVVESGASLILDLSDFSKDQQRTFVADFAERLYARKARQQALVHVILEEADEFAPQRARAGGDPEETSRMRGGVEALARRGRSRGIGLTMVTQRSSALSKDVLTQADLLIAMRTTGPTDIRSIQEWVRQNADAGDEVVRSLPHLQTGEGWVWNPERDLLARVHVRLAWTFDSSSTPKFGESRVTPARKATVQLPLNVFDLEEPEDPDDYRRIDEDGHYGCKIPGCEGRSKSKAGALAFLCPDHGGRPLDDVDEPELPVSPPQPMSENRKSGSEQKAEPSAEAESEAYERSGAKAPIEVDGVELFGITGHFAEDAERMRGEAERLRQQADALDRIVEGFEELARLQEAT